MVGTWGTGGKIKTITLPLPGTEQTMIPPSTMSSTSSQRLVWLKPASPPPSPPEILSKPDTDASDTEPSMTSSTYNPHEESSESESEDNSSTQSPPKQVLTKYKCVAQKVRPISMKTPEWMKPKRQFPKDPLLNLPNLPNHPPEFTPTQKVTAERMAGLGIDTHEELLPEEKKLLQHIIRLNERSIAFDESERGTFRSDYFSDYIIPTVEHEPWIEKNIPLPPAYKDELIQLLRDKIDAGVYESAQTAYRSKWFYVKKKDGGLRIVHDLQKLNSVTIRDSAVPPIIEEFVEAYAGRSVYTVLDMYWGFHARMLDVESRDMTAFQTPLGSFRLTSLPMGYANAPAEFQACMMFILQDEVPNVAGVFIDDVPIKGPASRYLGPDGREETIPYNPGIRRYIWEHLNDVHRILHRIGEAGGTVSAKKMQLCQAEVEIVGHQCSAKGREPVDSRTKRITNWPTPINLKEVRGFLGLCGTVRIWIENYSQISRPLVELTRKNTEFHWGPDQEEAFNQLKDLVTKAPALRPIDYHCGRPIVLAVDTSIYGIGFVLSQLDEKGRKVPARYGSLPLKPNEVRYGQSKLELYGLYRALRHFRAHISQVKNLVVQVDASSIKGMLNKPDEQPGALNRWIHGVLQFDFRLEHVPADKHRGPDALSRRRYTSADEEDLTESDPEEWIENIALAAQIQEVPPIEPFDTNINTSIEDYPFSNSPIFPLINDSTFLDDRGKNSFSAAVIHQYKDQDLIAILTYLVTNKEPEFRTAREREQFLSKAAPFYLEQAHMYRRRPGYPSQVVIFPTKRRQEILWEMHEGTAHHGIWAVEKQTTLRYYWPDMKKQIQGHIRSCHTCQLRSTKKMHIPITISHPPCLFSKVYLDVMNMPPARGKKWLVACRDDLSGITECEAIAHDKAKVIAQFFLKRIILRYGIVQEVVTDNGPSFGKEFAKLMKQYGIYHIKISPYNSQANGVVERGHFNIREAIVKLCDGDLNKWPLMVPAAVYADRITVRRATGYSPYFLLHGVHPLMPGDLADATFLVTDFRPGMSTAELIEARTRQLLRLPQDVTKAQNTLKQSRLRSKEAFETKFARRICRDEYKTDTLVLIRNNPIENSVSIERKTANRYMGPYRIVRRTQGGAYILAEMDGALLRHHVAAYRLTPYIQRNEIDEIANDLDISSEPATESDSDQSDDINNEDPQLEDSDGSSLD